MAASRFDDIIDSLKRLQQEIPDSLSMKDIKQDIGNTIRNINSPLLIMVMGEFSTGKSTFINALVGQDIAKVDAKPTTAVITKLVYGANDKITVVFRDGSRKNYDPDSFAKLTAETDDETNELHEKMDYVERAMPIEILKSMSIIDSPGLNSIKAVHEETTRRFMDNADTVIWLFDAHNPGRQTEIDALKRLNPRLSPLVLVNKIDAIDEDEGDSVEQVITGIERTLRNNKLEAQRIIGVSAKMAVQGKKNNNEKLVEASRIVDFYTAIEEVVLPRREEYKRNSLLDGLARIVFCVGNAVAEERAKTADLRDTDYTKYIETESSLAATTDELEIIAAEFVDELKQKTRLIAAEKAFFGVLYWLGLCVEKDEKTAQQYLEEAAVRSDATAQENLAAVCQRLGQDDKAKYWFGKLGLLDKFAEEMYQKGKMLEETQDYDAALKWYQKGADAGNESAKARIQEIQKLKKQQSEQQVPQQIKNHAVPVTQTKKPLPGDDMYQQGIMYYNHQTTSKNSITEDLKEALNWYRKAADKGNPLAMCDIGHMYEHGLGVKTDKESALKWYQKAADAGIAKAKKKVDELMQQVPHQKKTQQSTYAVPKAHDKTKLTGEEMYRLGNQCHNSGHDNEAIEWYKQDATKGYVAAMYHLGNIYENSNREESIKWYTQAADAGHKLAQTKVYGTTTTSLYQMHKSTPTTSYNSVYASKDNNSSYDIPSYSPTNHSATMTQAQKQEGERLFQKGKEAYRSKDFSTALSSYQQSASIGNVDAMYEIGKMYHDGYGLSCDYFKAMEWYQKAAQKGHTGAMDNIGLLYKYGGPGVTKDYSLALKWFQQASDNGDSYAEKHLVSLQEQLNKPVQKRTKNNGCYITTAVCNTLQKTDDCYELTMFRKFRDSWLKAQPDGEELIQDYYAIAPTIVANIDARNDAQETYCKIWKDYLSPCLTMLENGRNAECKSMYTRMVLDLKKRFIH